MRIISKFKDYYDGVAYTSGVGDDTLLYNRAEEVVDVYCESKWNRVVKHPKEITFPVNQLSSGRFTMTNGSTRGYSISVVGFCGKLYVCSYIWEKSSVWADIMSKFTYEKDVVVKFLESTNATSRYKFSLERELKMVHYVYDTFQLVENDALFHELGVPVFRVGIRHNSDMGKVSVAKNTELKKVHFYQVFDAFSAFQEIEQYLGGVLTNNSPSPTPLEEKQAVISHGFDPIYGFRNRGKK